MIIKKCLYCGKDFKARWRPAHAKFCTHKCAAIHREREFAFKREAMFWSKIKRGSKSKCWPWQGCTTSQGYGVTSVKGQWVTAHRLAYTLTFGKIPAGKLVCHTCDRRECCNPEHLWLGSLRDNNLDMRAKGRAVTRAKKGESNGTPYVPSRE